MRATLDGTDASTPGRPPGPTAALSGTGARRRGGHPPGRGARAGPGGPRYLALVETGALPLDDLVAELTVGESYFFREPAQFECIRREILPEVGRLRGPGHGLRVWSAGCAAGEEPYSLAILLEEEGIAGAHLLGTDISRPALARARRS